MGLVDKAQDNADALVIRVKDTGCGMSQAEMLKVFDPFFSTKRTTGKVEGSGTGLGLALCKKVVEVHNGTITVDSQPNQGTTFTITLPKK